jgi:hypothetical protein
MDDSSRDGDDDLDVVADSDLTAGPPRWVKIIGTITLILLVLFVVLHLTGNGFGSHLHGGGDAPRVEERGE